MADKNLPIKPISRGLVGPLLFKSQKKSPWAPSQLKRTPTGRKGPQTIESYGMAPHGTVMGHKGWQPPGKRKFEVQAFLSKSGQTKKYFLMILRC
jgi:hypothetical protein